MSNSVSRSVHLLDADTSVPSQPELLPLQSLLDDNLRSEQSMKTFPRIATKNNILKLNWWHSPTQHLEVEATFAQPKPKTAPHLINNNNTPNHNSLNTVEKPTSTLRQVGENDLTSAPSVFQSTGAINADNDTNSVFLDDHFNMQDSQLLVNDSKPCIGFLNKNLEDEMKISGYRRSPLRLIFCWICICLTAGLLRLVMHWWRHWYLLATCKLCPLQDADQVLVEEDYQGKHKLYHVRPVRTLSIQELKKSLRQECVRDSTSQSSKSFDENDVQLSVHFSSALFKNYQTLKVFNCKQLVYAWDANLNSFNKINGLDVDIPCSYFHQQQGLTIADQLSRRIVYGINEISIPYKDVKTLLFLEVLNPFYVFQIFSVILWFTYNYYYYACVILLMSIFGITMSILQTKKNQDVLRETVLNTGDAMVLNAKGIICKVPTRDLVLGDIIEIPAAGCTMQCDAVLLSGNCILDESMLTGESVPVTKTPLPIKGDVIYEKKEHARHTLFCGTKVIQTRYIGSKKVLAFVINTGNITAKGGLIRSILYPPPVDYKFEQDSYKFIQFLALIACIGFVYTLVSKILRGTDPVKIAVESLDLITIVVPPALPAAMTVGRLYAQKRLQKSNIFCISPRSITVAGSIDCCCFDKTGTLTEDGLDMWRVVPKSSTNQFQIPIEDVKRLPYDNFLFGMVTCHSITVMNGRLMGDPLDLKMFESTGWLLEDSKNVPENEHYGLIYPTILRQPNNSGHDILAKVSDDASLFQRQSSVDDLLADAGLSMIEKRFDHGIVREFPFTSTLQRMSVITRCLNAHLQGFKVYCKGSPEMIQQLCRQESIPDTFSQQLATFAKKGYRIIALAFKSLSPKLNYTKAQRMSREDVEKDLEFLGFVILENRLKPDTSTVIKSLTAANIRTIMVTGDNILTAMSVARDCGIVKVSQPVITVHANTMQDPLNGKTAKFELQYTIDLGSKTYNTFENYSSTNGITLALQVDSECTLTNGRLPTLSPTQSSYSTSKLQTSDSLTSVKTCDTLTHNDMDIEIGLNASTENDTAATFTSNNCDLNWRTQYAFAMDGKTWQIVRDHFPEQLEIILTRGLIYARMSPEQKQTLVMELQKLDFCVAMCGDGANDCGALKVAHAGISLSETESSIASPFTSKNPTIAAVPNVIKEGRAALVTSFGIFKYMAAYSLVQFISVMILYSIDSNLTDKQYLYIDLGLISIFAFFFGKTEAYRGPLVKQAPLNSLISPTPLVSLLLHLGVVVVFQVCGWFQLHHQPWFVPFTRSDEDHFGCVENYTMFAISSFQYITLAYVFSKGAPYRRPIWSNWPLCLFLVINVCIVIYLIAYPSVWISNFFQLIVPTEMSFRYLMLVYGILIFVCHAFVEICVVEYLVFRKFQVRRERDYRTSKRKYMRLEYRIQSMNKWPPITEVYEPHDSSTEEEIKPTYINLGAEQKQDLSKHSQIFPGFFDVEHTQHFRNANSHFQVQT